MCEEKTEYERAKPTATTDRQCNATTECDPETQVVSRAATATTDTVCTVLGTAPSTQELALQLNFTADVDFASVALDDEDRKAINEELSSQIKTFLNKKLNIPLDIIKEVRIYLQDGGTGLRSPMRSRRRREASARPELTAYVIMVDSLAHTVATVAAAQETLDNEIAAPSSDNALRFQTSRGAFYIASAAVQGTVLDQPEVTQPVLVDAEVPVNSSEANVHLNVQSANSSEAPLTDIDSRLSEAPPTDLLALESEVRNNDASTAETYGQNNGFSTTALIGLSIGIVVIIGGSVAILYWLQPKNRSKVAPMATATTHSGSYDGESADDQLDDDKGGKLKPPEHRLQPAPALLGAAVIPEANLGLAATVVKFSVRNSNLDQKKFNTRDPFSLLKFHDRAAHAPRVAPAPPAAGASVLTMLPSIRSAHEEQVADVLLLPSMVRSENTAM